MSDIDIELAVYLKVMGIVAEKIETVYGRDNEAGARARGWHLTTEYVARECLDAGSTGCQLTESIHEGSEVARVRKALGLRERVEALLL